MNNTPAGIVEIFLQPGEWYFGDHQVRIRTLLGSCVAMVFWHPKRLVGGMCHFMLPAGGPRNIAGAYPQSQSLSGRYADEAMLLLMQEMHKSGAPYCEYQAKLFGGGDMFAGIAQQTGAQVGQRNVKAARHLVREHGFHCVAEHLGGEGHRNVIFDIWSGHVWMRQHGHKPPSTRNSTMLAKCRASQAVNNRQILSPPSNTSAIPSVRTAGEVAE